MNTKFIPYLFLVLFFVVGICSCTEEENKIDIPEIGDEMYACRITDSNDFNYFLQNNALTLLIQDENYDRIPEHIAITRNDTRESMLLYLDVLGRPSIINVGDYQIYINSCDSNVVDVTIIKEKEEKEYTDIKTATNWNKFREEVQSDTSRIGNISEPLNFLQNECYYLIKNSAHYLEVIERICRLSSIQHPDIITSLKICFEETLLACEGVPSESMPQVFGVIDEKAITSKEVFPDGYITTYTYYQTTVLIPSCIPTGYNDWMMTHQYNFLHGVWDYYYEGDSFVTELIFFKTGAFHDYVDFHTSGDYHIDFINQTVMMDYYDILSNKYLGRFVFKYLILSDDNVEMYYDGYKMVMHRKERSEYYDYDDGEI